MIGRYVGKVVEINRRRTKNENVSVEYDEEQGKTLGLMVADAETYGSQKLWVLLKPIPIELDSDSPPLDSDDDLNDDELGGAGSSQAQQAKRPRLGGPGEA